jgi:hypothetical protein
VHEARAELVAALFWQTKNNPVVYPATPPAHFALIGAWDREDVQNTEDIRDTWPTKSLEPPAAFSIG